MKVKAANVLASTGDHDPTIKRFDNSEKPDGNYLCYLERAEDDPRGNFNKLQLSWVIIDGDYDGSWLFGTIFYPDGSDDEKTKQFASTVYATFTIDIRTSGDFDLLEVAKSQIGSRELGPYFVVNKRTTSVQQKKNAESGFNNYFANATPWNGTPVKSPKKGQGTAAGVTAAAPIPATAAPIPQAQPQAPAPAPVPDIPRPKSPLIERS